MKKVLKLAVAFLSILFILIVSGCNIKTRLYYKEEKTFKCIREGSNNYSIVPGDIQDYHY